MKNILVLTTFAMLCFFCSCEKGVEIEGGTARTTLSLSNWTGHWDNICSTGRTLTFVVTVDGVTEEHVINKDSSAGFTGEVNEGDRVSVQVFDDNGTVFLNREKNFTPSDPGQPSPSLDMAPYVQVCDISELDFFGF